MIRTRTCLLLLGLGTLLTTPSCMVFEDAVTKNVAQVYGPKSALLTVEGETATFRRLGEAKVNDPPLLDKRYPLDQDPPSYLIFQKNVHGSVEARVFDSGGDVVWTGDFIGYIGKARSTAWGLSLGSRTTGDAESPAE